MIDAPEFENEKVRTMALFDANQDIWPERGELKMSDAVFAAAESEGRLSGLEFIDASFAQFSTIDTDRDGKFTAHEFAVFARQVQFLPITLAVTLGYSEPWSGRPTTAKTTAGVGQIAIGAPHCGGKSAQC